jgi:hypothetical protein
LRTELIGSSNYPTPPDFMLSRDWFYLSDGISIDFPCDKRYKALLDSSGKNPFFKPGNCILI